MKRAVVCLAVFCASPAFSQGKSQEEVLREVRRELCEGIKKTPQEACKAMGGKWTDGVCVKTRIKRVVKHVRVRRFPSQELMCFRRGGEWRDGLCYEKQETPAAPAVRQKQKTVNVVVVTAPPKPEAKPLPPPSANKVEKPQKRDWWWLSGGAFAAGIWKGHEFYAGPYGQLKFAFSDRFRVGGSAGYSIWQPSVVLSADFDVHLKEWHRGLFLKFSVTSIWTKYTNFYTVRHREFLGGVGGEYWFTKYFSISADFLIGVKSYIPSGNEPPIMGEVVAGNRLNLMFHL